MNRITDASSRELAEIFNSVYELMLMMLARFFAHGGETEEQLRLLSRGTLRMMASGLRPLGEALARMPAGPNYPGLTAGPPFGITQNVRLLSHRKAAWIFFLERLYDLSTRLTNLAKEATLPQEVQEAAAALESVAEHLTPFIPPEFAQAVREECDGRSNRTTIRPELDGPYIVRNLRKLTNSKGESLNVRPILALCRCGGSHFKPYCDGTHARINFCSIKQPDRTPDRLDTYEAKEITVLDNRGTCSHFGNCTDHLPEVFHVKGEPFVTPQGAPAETNRGDRPAVSLGRTRFHQRRHSLRRRGARGRNHRFAQPELLGTRPHRAGGGAAQSRCLPRALRALSLRPLEEQTILRWLALLRELQRSR